jgi:Zn-dependent protease with chaperone function
LYKKGIAVHRRFNNFWARIYTVSGLVLLASLFNAVPYGLMKAAVALGFLVFAELLVVSWYGTLLDRTFDWFRTMRRLITKSGIEKRPLPPELAEVSNAMGMKVTELWIIDGLDNAFSLPMWKVIVLGRPLFDKLSQNATKAVFAHELAHVKGKHNLLHLLPWAILWAQLVLWRNLPLQMLIIAGFAFYLLASVPVSWMTEYLADRKARNIVGAEAMIEALEVLCHNTMAIPSETHPSPLGRIKRLRTGAVPIVFFAIWMAAWFVGSYVLVIMTV